MTMEVTQLLGGDTTGEVGSVAIALDRIQNLLKSQGTQTPCFVYDEAILGELLKRVATIQASADVGVLYALKPFALFDALQFMAPGLAGFAASSLFEARLARQALGDRGSVHFTSPGLRPTEVPQLLEACDYISFNSLPQWARHECEAHQFVSCGLRVNPNVSLVSDPRYDPCRRHSKLGVPVRDMVAQIKLDPKAFERLRGIHFHTNCDSTDFAGLLQTAEIIDQRLGALLPHLEWINLGGGYLFPPNADYSGLRDTTRIFRAKYGLQIFCEPGAALVREAGFIVSSVVDIFDSGGKTVAVLDTTVGHMPEVFEYGFEPDVVGHDEKASHNYILAGSSCLAGDVFGEYAFHEPLVPGARVVFHNAGAYTLAKAHMFNGIDLPAIYALTLGGDLLLKSSFGYPVFADRWNARIHAPV